MRRKPFVTTQPVRQNLSDSSRVSRFLGVLPGLTVVLSEFHAIASGREILPHDTYDRVVIVDDEDTGRLARHSYSYVTSRL